MLGCKVLRESPKEFVQIEIAGVPIWIDLLDPSASGQSNNIGVLFNPLSLERWVGVKDSDGNELIFLTHDEGNNRRDRAVALQIALR